MHEARIVQHRGMWAFICVTCGSQFAESEREPGHCPICEDERQYVGLHGQKWTTLDDLRGSHKNRFVEEEPGLLSMVTNPRVGIGQRAFLLRTPGGQYPLGLHFADRRGNCQDSDGRGRVDLGPINVIASEAKQSIVPRSRHGLLRRKCSSQ